MIHEGCRSHNVSQFAAFFIVARAKRSIVKSCHLVVILYFIELLLLLLLHWKWWWWIMIDRSQRTRNDGWRTPPSSHHPRSITTSSFSTANQHHAVHHHNTSVAWCLWGGPSIISSFDLMVMMATLPHLWFNIVVVVIDLILLMILPQVHLRKPCYDFYFL